jgi:hypothetical protein
MRNGGWTTAAGAPLDGSHSMPRVVCRPPTRAIAAGGSHWVGSFVPESRYLYRLSIIDRPGGTPSFVGPRKSVSGFGSTPEIQHERYKYARQPVNTRSTPRTRRRIGLLSHGIYLIIIVALGTCLFLQSRPRVINLSPPRIVPLGPPYLQLPVKLHPQELTLREYARLLTDQTHIPIIILNQVAMTQPTTVEGKPAAEVRIAIRADGEVSLREALIGLPNTEDGSGLVAAFEEHRVCIGPDDVIHSPQRAISVVYPIADFLVIDNPLLSGVSTSDRIQQLKTLIQGIEPTSWVCNGGALGDIQMMDDELVIKTTPDLHYQIAELLYALRQRGK